MAGREVWPTTRVKIYKVRCSSILRSTEYANYGSDHHLKVIVDSRAMNVPSWHHFLAVDQAFMRQ